MFRTKFGRSPKVIRSDRGGEFTGHDVTQYLKTYCIDIQYTTSYSPQQNAVVKRKNRSLMEMERCMLIDAKMEYKYLVEAVAAANFIHNRLQSRAVDVTPYQLQNGRKPRASMFQVFGSSA